MGTGRQLFRYVSDYTVFDLETTGINPMQDEIVEISAIKVRNGKAADTFSTLVRPGRPMPPAASAVNGITDEMLAGAPDIREVLPQFLAFAGEDVLVGHNIAGFDLQFLNRAAAGMGRGPLSNDYADTLPMAHRRLPQLSRHRLVDLAAYLKISTDGAHRALNDCVMNQKCYEALGRLPEGAPAAVCPLCGGELIRRQGKLGAFWGCGNYPRCRYTRNA